MWRDMRVRIMHMLCRVGGGRGGWGGGDSPDRCGQSRRRDMTRPHTRGFGRLHTCTANANAISPGALAISTIDLLEIKNCHARVQRQHELRSMQEQF